MSERVVSNYKIIEKIGAGGGGIVYLAEHLRLEKKVVLKADKGEIAQEDELLRREVDVLKELSHTYIPQVYDFFKENGTVYTVIDYVEGESLDKPLKRSETFSQPQVITWAQQLLEALCYLHSPTHGDPPRGFVHSDIKPANIMRRPNNDICLIDFNIALALGEANVIGLSPGYASPEHYGLDYSSEEGGKSTALLREEDGRTVRKLTSTVPRGATSREQSATARRELVVPDVRSDIYSVGATLYHLLSGKRPAKDAKEVIPLSAEEFSPQIVQIISKSMNPNPNLRYQTAEEMLTTFRDLWPNDPRVQKRKRIRRAVCSALTVTFLSGVLVSFTGLKRMQTTEQWLKLAEYSRNALAQGDSASAVSYALQALPEQRNILVPPYTAQAQKALADALGVYDLADGYKVHKTVELPAAPLYMTMAPDGRTAACLYAYSVAVFDTETAEIVVTLPAEASALAEVVYVGNDMILYAGENGITAYDIAKGTILWTGKPATSIAISGDGTCVAAVYKEESFATVYDTAGGQIRCTVDFKGRRQQVTVNDRFANPRDNLLALNNDGTQMGVSFADGSLVVYRLDGTGGAGEAAVVSEETLLLFDDASGYTHFEGGFYQQYFACTASGPSESVFAVVDTTNGTQTGGFQSEYGFSVQTDETGIYLQTENLLVKLHPETGEQTPLVSTAEPILRFARSDSHTLIATEKEALFFDRNAVETDRCEKEAGSAFVQIAAGTALIGNMDSPVIRIMKYENHPETELLAYDVSFDHDEARISADGETFMLFSYRQFCLYDKEGKSIKTVDIPNPEQVYDQQYRRDEAGSRLEVIYYDGTIVAYDARDGAVLYEKAEEPPDPELQETFYTEHLRIESPLHGTPEAYDRKTGRPVRQLEPDAYLTYVTQAGAYVVTQYVTADGYCYGQLLDERCEVLAQLPYLCDVVGDRLIFDYPSGDLRETRIYELEELRGMARGQ